MFTPEALTRSRECLEQAIALDPEFALPYVGLADHHLASTLFGSARDIIPRSRKLAERALELDPDLPEANGMLGVLAGFCEGNWEEAGRFFEAVLARDPVPWHVRTWYSVFYLFPLGRLIAVKEQAERALEDDPLSQMLLSNLGIILEALGEEANAESALARSVESDTPFWWGGVNLGLFYAVHGKVVEARAVAEKAHRISSNACTTGLLAAATQLCGEGDRVEALIRKVESGMTGAGLGLAIFHTATGDFDRAVDQLLVCAEDLHLFSQTLIALPYASRLRRAAAWPLLMKRLNLPETR